MKKLTGFHKYVIGQALGHYNDLIDKQEFPKNSIVTKEYLQMQIQEVLSLLNLAEKTK
jgi:predicted oxidoreductase (fatty acid repression mutant protein)